jgi:hypothetical protein
MNVCTAFDSKIFWAWSFWESPNNKVPISFRKLWWCKKLKRIVLCSIHKRQFKRKWEASSLIYPQTHLESVIIILDRNRSYLSELQLWRNLAYKTLGLLSPTKKWNCWPSLFKLSFDKKKKCQETLWQAKEDNSLVCQSI